MARIERTAPSATSAPPPAARRIGRVSQAGPKSEAREKLMGMIENHLKLIAVTQNRIDYLRASIQPEIDLNNIEIERIKGVLREEMVKAGLNDFTDGEWEAKFVTEMTRASREVDIVKVRDALSEEDFMQVIKVQVTKLREVMGEREIDKISDITPAAPGETKFVVGPVEIKKPRTKKLS